MRWKIKAKNPFEWQPYFCWYPVGIGDEMVWLERIMRKVDKFTLAGPIYIYGNWND